VIFQTINMLASTGFEQRRYHQQTKEYLPWIGEMGDCHCGKANVTKRSSCNFKHGFVPPISIEAGDNMFFVGLPHYAT